MEITNANAEVVLPYIEAALRDCTYFALDMEFTGIDRELPENFNPSPEEAREMLLRQPADMYAKKLEAVRRYSAMEIGISIFTKVEKPAVSAEAKEHSAKHARFDQLVQEVTTLFPQHPESYRYYSAALKDVVIADWAEMQVEILRMSDAVADNMLTASGPYLVSLLHKARALEALNTAVLQRMREAERPSSAPPVTPFRVQTFTAHLFPAASESAPDLSLNIETAQFLVDNHMDFTQWVRDGLRFAPLRRVADAVAGETKARVRLAVALSHPREGVPHYEKVFGEKLDDLLPFTSGELELVKFVVELCTDGEVADSTLARHYCANLHGLLQFSRGTLHVSALPQSLFTADILYKTEMAALESAGLTKANRGYALVSTGGAKWRSPGNGNGGHASSTRLHGSTLLEIIAHSAAVSQKPLVLYNGYTDLMFFVLCFYGPSAMPPTLQGFKDLVHAHFPIVYDTRVLGCAGALQHLGNFTGRLSAVVDEMKKVSDITARVAFQFDQMTPGGANLAISANAHSAGFDALLTGQLFAYCVAGLEKASVEYSNYENYLATYSTLLSISLRDRDDAVLQEEEAKVYYTGDVNGLRVDAIREVLLRARLPACVMYRAVGYTIQPVGESTKRDDFQAVAQRELSFRAKKPVHLLSVDE